MNGARKAIHSAAARIYAMQAKGGRAEASAQRRAMSKTKRMRVRKTKGC